MMYSFTHLKTILLSVFLTTVTFNAEAQIGNASWYGPGFHGHKTASGERFNVRAMTAAHKTLKLGTRVKVTNLRNNKTVIVVINDRGPFVRGRIIDLSQAAKTKLSMNGTAKVRLEIID